LVFVEGKLVERQAIESRPLQKSNSRFLIGGRQFSGLIDEVRVSNIARYDSNFTPPERHLPDAHTLALFHCDEGQGDTLVDHSGQGCDARIVGAHWVKVPSPGGAASPVQSSSTRYYVNQGSLSFDGVDDFVQVPRSRADGIPIGDAPRTVELWFNTQRDLTGPMPGSTLFHYGFDALGRLFSLVTHPIKSTRRGTLYSLCYFADLEGESVVQRGEWTHAAMTYDGTAVSLFVNGQLEVSAPKLLNTPITDGGFLLGFRPFPADPQWEWRWHGFIDEVRIWSVARTAEEIQRDMRRRLGADGRALPNELVAYYTFDDGTALDLAGGDNNGDLAGGAKAPEFTRDAPVLDDE
jgi:hypothetical protein